MAKRSKVFPIITTIAGVLFSAVVTHKLMMSGGEGNATVTEAPVLTQSDAARCNPSLLASPVPVSREKLTAVMVSGTGEEHRQNQDQIMSWTREGRGCGSSAYDVAHGGR